MKQKLIYRAYFGSVPYPQFDSNNPSSTWRAMRVRYGGKGTPLDKLKQDGWKVKAIPVESAEPFLLTQEHKIDESGIDPLVWVILSVGLAAFAFELWWAQ